MTVRQQPGATDGRQQLVLARLARRGRGLPGAFTAGRVRTAAFIETALAEVCFGQEDSHPLEATIERYFTPDYTQRTDGDENDARLAQVRWPPPMP